uniref:Chorismate lyase n=1 Tax=Periphykon beckeri TaxID=2006982 RepID=A0A1Z1M3E1_9FLOR|nr:hypothetical protein [Periphykon beckeri]ARW60351.1 hypothetical protein [Periphykon beckeri]
MEFYINKFYPVWILSLQQNNIIRPKTSNLIQNQFKAIVINDGSHTRLIEYLNNQVIKIKILEQNADQKRIRYVWLETILYKKITCARSLWKIKKNQNINKINKNLPIGKSFINAKIDIHKEIRELYYGYCKDIEKELRSKKGIWGRKYQLNYEDYSFILIQEFFSAQTAFFHKNIN